MMIGEGGEGKMVKNESRASRGLQFASEWNIFRSRWAAARLWSHGRANERRIFCRSLRMLDGSVQVERPAILTQPMADVPRGRSRHDDRRWAARQRRRHARSDEAADALRGRWKGRWGKGRGSSGPAPYPKRRRQPWSGRHQAESRKAHPSGRPLVYKIKAFL